MISIVLPCRNEQFAVGECITRIGNEMAPLGIPYEIIVSDSSTDDSWKIAESLGAIVVKHDQNGYGNALRKGIESSRGSIIIMMDSDLTYDFSDIPFFLGKLKDGFDIVIGNRFGNNSTPAGMPVLHAVVGRPLFRTILFVMHGIKVNDPHCGFRAFYKKAYDIMNLQSEGMEFASEMLIQSKKKGLKIAELSTGYFPRKGDSKLRTIRDGLRHLKLISESLFY